MRHPLAVGLLVIAAAWTSGCERNAASGGDRSPLPVVDAGQFAPILRERIEDGRRRIESNPRDAAAYGGVAMALHAAGYLEAAAAYYRRARDEEPGSVRWSINLAYVLESLGELSAAIEATRRARVELPDDPAVAVRLADLLRADGRIRQASELYESLAEDPRWGGRARYGAGMIALDAGHLDEAEKLLEEARERHPRTPEIRYALATVYRRQGRPERAAAELVAFEEDRRLVGAFQPPIPVEVAQLALQAERQVSARSVDRDMTAAGIVHFERQLIIEPDDRGAHVMLVALYGADGRMDRAGEHYDAAKRLQPIDADLEYLMGNLLLAAGRFQDARDHYDMAIAARRGFARAYMQRGQALERQGLFDSALEDFSSAVRLDPSDALARRFLGRRLALAGDFGAASGYVGSDADGPLAAWELLALAGLRREQAGFEERLTDVIVTAERSGDAEVGRAARALLVESGGEP